MKMRNDSKAYLNRSSIYRKLPTEVKFFAIIPINFKYSLSLSLHSISQITNGNLDSKTYYLF